jgi:hypothetical protein
MNYQIAGKNLKIGSLEVSFAANIKNVIEAEGVLLVEIEYLRDLKNRNNIYGVNNRGEIVWQIQDAFPSEHHWLSKLMQEPDGIWCASTHGHRLKIDPQTGRILDDIFTK